MAVKSEVIRLSPVLYVVKLSGSGVLIGSWDYDVSIVSVLAKFFTSKVSLACRTVGHQVAGTTPATDLDLGQWR